MEVCIILIHSLLVWCHGMVSFAAELILGEPLFSGVHAFEVMRSIITRLGAATEDLAYLQSFCAWDDYQDYQQENDPPQEINPADWPLDIPQAAMDLILVSHQVLPYQYSLFIKYLIKYQMAMAGYAGH